MKELSKFKQSKFYIFWVCTGWIRGATLVMIADNLFCYYCLQNFPEINILWFLIQWILGMSFYAFIVGEMVFHYKARKKVYLYVRRLLENEEEVPIYVGYQFGTRCERSCLRSLERDFKVKFL